MSDISFDDSSYKFKSRTILRQEESPAMIRSLVTRGIVKNEKQALALMTSCSILFFLAALYIFAVYVFDFRLGTNAPVTKEQIMQNRAVVPGLLPNNAINKNEKK